MTENASKLPNDDAISAEAERRYSTGASGYSAFCEGAEWAAGGEIRRLNRLISNLDRERDFRSTPCYDKMIGGSDVCATCEAHCVTMIEDEEEASKQTKHRITPKQALELQQAAYWAGEGGDDDELARLANAYRDAGIEIAE